MQQSCYQKVKTVFLFTVWFFFAIKVILAYFNLKKIY